MANVSQTITEYFENKVNGAINKNEGRGSCKYNV